MPQRKFPGTAARWEYVYSNVRRRILACDLLPGVAVSESALAKEYGTSPTPVRDALSRLRQEGLVVPGSGRGYRVAPLRLADIKELAELRSVLEAGVVRLVVQRVNPSQLDKFRSLACLEKDRKWDGPERIKRNRLFHLEMAELTGNARLAAMVARVFDDSERLFHLGISGLPTDEMEAVHLRLVDAISRGDAEDAIAICQQEASSTAERVLRALVRREPPADQPSLALVSEV